MPLADARQLLAAARAGGYALPAFNVSNLEFVRAVVAAAEDEKAPIFVAASEGAFKYAGDVLATIARELIAASPVDVVLHLDHGSSLASARHAIGLGFNSVMLDGSKLQYEDNVALAAAAVKEFAPAGITLEAELGHVGGDEDPSVYTEPAKAAAFVEATGVDALAVAVGTSHGAYKFKGEPTIDLARLEAIAAATPVPLVLHGASAVYPDVVAALAAAGGAPGNARGLPDELLAAAVRRGIAKVNVDTDLRLAFAAATRAYLKANPADVDPKKYLAAGREAVRAMARRKIRACRP